MYYTTAITWLNRMINIHFDFTDGTELSYGEGIDKRDNFITNCLSFFDSDLLDEHYDIVVTKLNGDYISMKELLDGDIHYTNKRLTMQHNLYRLLVGDVFNWKKQINHNTKEN